MEYLSNNIIVLFKAMHHLLQSILPLFLTYLVRTAGVNWNQHDDIRTGQQVMFPIPNSTATFYRAIDPPVSYYIVYSSSISSTRSAGVGIVGFNSIISYDYSMNTTVENFTTYSLRVTAKVYGDTVLSYYAINWIAVGNLPNFIQVLFNCHLCTNIRVGRGDRSQTRTGVTLFTNYQHLYVNVYLAGFSLRNVDGITNYLKATASIANLSSIINYQFSVNQNNTVSQVCYTTIIYNDIITKNLYEDWGWTGSDVLSNKSTQSPTTISFATAMPNSAVPYRQRDRMFFGMSAFNLSRARDRKFVLDTDQRSNLNTNYDTNEGTYAVTIDFFMIAVRGCNASDPWFDVYDMDCENDCDNPANDPTRYQTNPGSFCYGCHYSCQNCSGSHKGNCSSCEQLMFRQLVSGQCRCNSSYVDIGIQLCYPCQSFIPGCDTCLSTILCLTCFPGFLLQPNGLCQCTSGFLVSGVCTNITGCTSLVLYAGTTFCLSCNTTLNFQTTSSYTCQCMPGYYISGTWLCLPKCGDARQITQEGCDDGNNINGDGCSSTCFTQSNWICLGGSASNRSICYIYDSSLSLQVKYVRRQTTGNRMEVGLKIVPLYSQLQLINYKQYLSHNVPCSYFNATYFNNYLVLEFDYNHTIEGQIFDLYLNLDPNIFYNTTLHAQVPASGMNAKLTYDTNNSINHPFEIIVIVLDVCAIIIMFASSFSETMIGIEMIQILQTVLYTQAVMKSTPSSLSPLQMLKYSSGFNEIGGIDFGRTYTFAFSLSSLGLQKQFLLSFNVMFIILMIVVVLCIILKGKQYYHESKVGKFSSEEDQDKNSNKLAKVTKIYNFVFERILFLIAFISMFLIIFALMLQLTDMSSSYTLMPKQFNLLGAGVAISILSCLISAVILNGCFPGTLLFPKLIKQYYPPIYFVYQSTFIFVLAFLYTQQYVLYILLSLSFLFMLYNILHRPYPQKFHAFVLIFHQFIIMGVIGIYIFQNLTKPTEHQFLYKILNGIIIALLYVVVILNAYRIYKYYRFIKIKGWDQYGNQIYRERSEQDGDQNLNYKVLATPKQASQKTKKPNQTKKTRERNANNNDNLVELQQIKKPKETKSKPVQDQSAMNWKYNMLADEQNPRFQATNRDVKPDTFREGLNRTKTVDKNREGDISFNENKQEGKELDEENTIKDLQDRNKSGNKKKNEDENVFDSPYDEGGYAKKTKGEKVEEEDDDPLQRIKRRLKQDFSSKVKSSTMKQL